MRCRPGTGRGPLRRLGALSGARGLVRTALRAGRRARFHAWAARLDLELRRHGARLVLDAPHAARFASPPAIEVLPLGAGPATLTLRLGRDVDLGRGLVLEAWGGHDNRLEIGDETTFRSGARLQLRGGTIRLGARAQVRDHVLLKSNGLLEAGDEVVIGHASVVTATECVILAGLVGVGEHVSITDSDHGADGSDAHYLHQPLRVAPVRLERNVLVSAGARILRGTHVGPNAVIAAGAVLTGGEYPGAHLIAGVPAHARRALPGAPGDQPEPDTSR